MRGLTVLLMAFVNLQGSSEGAWRQLVHAPWHGLTAADLVFPWFLLIVGLSIPLAIDSGRPLPLKLLKRSAVLVGLGVVLAWLIHPTFDLAAVRWMGVLQRIGLVYFASALVARFTRGWGLPVLAAVLCVTVHAVLLNAAPPGGGASLAPGLGMSGWLDRSLLPGRLYPPGYDPEGVLSSLGAMASGLIGVSMMRVVRRTPAEHRWAIMVAAVALASGGLIWSLWIPLNKALWTPSFTLLTAGLGLLAWVGLQAMWSRIGGSPIGRGLVFYGRTALTFYVVHMLLIAILVRTLPGGEHLWDAGYELLRNAVVAPAVAATLFAVLATAASTAVTVFCARRGWLLKV